MTGPISESLSGPCPVLEQAQQVVDDAQKLNRSINWLRRAMRQCASCERCGDCPALEEIHERIYTTLLEIYQQWNLS